MTPARRPRGTHPAHSRTHPLSLRDGERTAGTAAARAHRFAPASVLRAVIAIAGEDWSARTAAAKARRAPASVRRAVIAVAGGGSRSARPRPHRADRSTRPARATRDNRDMALAGYRHRRDNRDMAIDPPLEAPPLPAPRPCAG